MPSFSKLPKQFQRISEIFFEEILFDAFRWGAVGCSTRVISTIEIKLS
jgi:hypothetical protein